MDEERMRSKEKDTENTCVSLQELWKVFPKLEEEEVSGTSTLGKLDF